MLTRNQIVEMTKETLTLTLSKLAGAFPMSDKQRKRLEELKRQKEQEKAAERRLRA